MFRLTAETEAFICANAGAFHSDPKGIDTFKELKAWAATNGADASMPVYDQYDAANVFSSLTVQQAFQAWHDRKHLSLDRGFKLQDEHSLAVAHIDELLTEGLPFRDAVAIYFHIYGRNLFYWNHGKKTVPDVGAFVEDALTRGLKAATAPTA